MRLKKIFVLFMTLGVAACGFKPLYVEKTSGNNFWYYNNEYNSEIVQEMSKIKVETVSDRIGQLVKNELIDIFTPLGVPKKAEYFLKIKPIDTRRSEQALRDDITATREKVQYTVEYSLWSKEKGELFTDSARISLSYDLLDNPYSTTMDKKKIEKDGAKILADDMALRIGAFFHSLKSNDGNPDEL